MNKNNGAEEAKNSIDNPENAENDLDKNIVKKEIQMPLDGLTTQTFKVT
jgi:hypothetical protein